jgi:hypothetical protein
MDSAACLPAVYEAAETRSRRYAGFFRRVAAAAFKRAGDAGKRIATDKVQA